MRGLLSSVFLFTALLMSLPCLATDYHVAVTGSDAASGSEAEPFRTIQKAINGLRAGDTCIVHEGTYYETVKFSNKSGNADAPIRIIAANSESVTLDGTEAIDAEWSLHQGRIYKATVDARFEQLFVDNHMMIEARWPNMRFDQRFDRSCWAEAAEGSQFGEIVCTALSKTGIDWTGALATLNVGHQFYSWTRKVERHGKGSRQFTYAKTIKGLERFYDKPFAWADDYFYISGKLEALDSPSEWFLDEKTGTLYLYAPNGKSPEGSAIRYKARDFALIGSRCEHVQISGFRFFGTTFKFGNSHNCLVEDCRLLYPSYTRRITETDPEKSESPTTSMHGDHNTIRRIGVAYASNSGIVMKGSFNTLENCKVLDTNWVGTLNYPAVLVIPPYSTPEGGEGNVVRRNSLFNCGSTILSFNGRNSVVEYNHVHNGGLLCKDVSLVYTQLPKTSGSVIRYNWVHGCFTDSYSERGGLGGLGIRGDDETRGLSVHHNVVWDCGLAGILIKGDANQVYHNTVFNIGAEGKMGQGVYLPTMKEEAKAWRNQGQLLASQNSHSQITNNAAEGITCGPKLKPFADDKRLVANYISSPAKFRLVDLGKQDFRPAPGSSLIDAGKPLPSINDGYSGKAPDIGAYEYGGENWQPGADW